MNIWFGSESDRMYDEANLLASHIQRYLPGKDHLSLDTANPQLEAVSTLWGLCLGPGP